MPYSDTQGASMTDYETEFADLPDMVSGKAAARILDVAGIQGVHYVLGRIAEDENAPKVETFKITFGKRIYNQYRKSELIAVRRYRDKKLG